MNHEPPNTRLRLSREEMRALGYRVIDMLVEHVETLPEKPVTHAHQGARPRLEARLREPLPEHATAPEAVLEQLQRDVFSHISHVDHPRFFAFIPSVIYYSDQTHSSIERGLRVLGFSCVLVRERRWLKETFSVHPEYLQDTLGPEKEVNFADYGLQLTRYFRALKLWMSIKIFGLAAFREAVAHGFRLAEAAEQMVRERNDWEVVTPAQMAMLSFRYAPPGRAPSELDALNLEIIATMFDDGFAMLTTSVLRGRVVIRLCPINPRTTEDDIRHTLERLDGFARALTA